MTFIQKLVMLVVALVYILVFFGVIGWFMNAYKLTQLDFKPPYKAEIIRGVGLIPFVGAVTGYMDIKDN